MIVYLGLSSRRATLERQSSIEGHSNSVVTEDADPREADSESYIPNISVSHYPSTHSPGPLQSTEENVFGLPITPSQSFDSQSISPVSNDKATAGKLCTGYIHPDIFFIFYILSTHHHSF